MSELRKKNRGKPPLIVTPGDPAGIGPEISLRAFDTGMHNFVLMGDLTHLRGVADKIGLAVEFWPLSYDDLKGDFMVGAGDGLPVIDGKWAVPPVAGEADGRNAKQIIEAIRLACTWVKQGLFKALVTNPIAKAGLYEAGFDFPGHTEYLAFLDNKKGGLDAEKSDGRRAVMMLANQELRVVPLTIHVPLKEVECLIDQKLIHETLHVICRGLKDYFGLEKPHIAVCGLNPHAGENGHIGDFENRILRPALDAFENEGAVISGPYAADSLFWHERRAGLDAVLAMYHDQALIPIKTLDFYRSVNVTLGLSFVRTSPDHGTGFDRAARFESRADSLISALTMAEKMAEKNERARLK